jgi:hypothetical protein
MNNIETGGSAFPVVQKANAVSRGDGGGANYEMEQSGGMTLRDYFAAKAMQGLLAQSMGTALGSHPYFAAEYAYAMADAMIKARDQNA